MYLYYKLTYNINTSFFSALIVVNGKKLLDNIFPPEL